MLFVKTTGLWANLHIKGISAITGKCPDSAHWAEKGAHTLTGKHLLLLLFHCCACLPHRPGFSVVPEVRMGTGPRAVKGPYTIILLSSLSSQMELPHMKQGGLEKSEAHFLAESWGDGITVHLNVDERWGKSRGLPGGNLWEKEEAGESWKRLRECITGWEMNNRCRWTFDTVTHINTHVHTHIEHTPQAPLCWSLHKHLWWNCAPCWQNKYHNIDFHSSRTSDSMIQGKDLDLDYWSHDLPNCAHLHHALSKQFCFRAINYNKLLLPEITTEFSSPATRNRQVPNINEDFF